MVYLLLLVSLLVFFSEKCHKKVDSLTELLHSGYKYPQQQHIFLHFVGCLVSLDVLYS